MPGRGTGARLPGLRPRAAIGAVRVGGSSRGSSPTTGRWSAAPGLASPAERVRRVTAEFRWRHGSLDCRALLGRRIDTPERRDAARESGVFERVCPALVRSAAELAERELAAPPPGTHDQS